jgi:transposase
VVALDSHRGYARAVATHLARATLVIDHFHLIRLANQVIDDVRRRVQQHTSVQQHTTGHRGRKHDPLSGIPTLVITAWDDLDAPG